MNDHPNIARVLLGIFTALMVLGGVGLLLHTSFTDFSAAEAALPPDGDALTDAAPVRAGAEYAALRERPLMIPRESEKPAAPPAPAPAAPVGGYELRGTVINESQRFALFGKPGRDEVTVVSQGKGLAGWTLIGIAPDRVVFQRGGERITLVLEE